MNTKKGMRMGTALGVGAVLAGAAGAYWLYGAEGAAKHRRLAKSWMLKARAEVMDAVEKVQSLDKKQYMAIVDSAVKGTASAAMATRPEIALLTREMRSAWSHMQNQMKPKSKAKKGDTKAHPKTKLAKRSTKK